MSTCSSTSLVHVHYRLAGLGARSHLLVSIRCRNTCSTFSFKCDTFKKLSAHMKLHICCVHSSSRSQGMLFFPSSILQPHWPESQWPFSNVPLSQASVDLKITLHTHSKVALFSNPHISSTKTAMNHPSVAWLSKNFATCFGFVSSETVLMSKFAKCIVGGTALPCLNDGFHSSCHSQCW